jgi:hypothetical protein
VVSSPPATIDATDGAPSSSWITVSFVTPPSIDSISYVSRVKPSASAVGSISMRQVWTSLRGGSDRSNRARRGAYHRLCTETC